MMQMGIKNINTKIGQNTISKKHPIVDKLNMELLNNNFDLGETSNDEDDLSRETFDKNGN